MVLAKIISCEYSLSLAMPIFCSYSLWIRGRSPPLLFILPPGLHHYASFFHPSIFTMRQPPLKDDLHLYLSQRGGLPHGKNDFTTAFYAKLELRELFVEEISVAIQLLTSP